MPILPTKATDLHQPMPHDDELWTWTYSLKPYLSGCSVDDLHARFGHLTTVLADRGLSGAWSLPSPTVRTREVFERRVHCVQELRARGHDVPAEELTALLLAALPVHAPASSPLDVPADGDVVGVRPSNVAIDRCLFKFGRVCFMRELLCDGIVTFGHQSKYQNYGLDQQIGDRREGVAERLIAGDLTVMQVWSPDLTTYKGPIRPMGNVAQSRSYSGDFYVFSAAQRFCRRAWCDYAASQYDCAVVIHDRETFESRLWRALDEQLPPGWGLKTDAVVYRDPFFDDLPPADGFLFTKRFEYAHQEEYRGVLLPPRGEVMAADRMAVRLGSLEDIAFLFIPGSS